MGKVMTIRMPMEIKSQLAREAWGRGITIQSLVNMIFYRYFARSSPQQ